MKRNICILLTVIMIILCIPTVDAGTTQDKISPELRALLAEHPETGIENGVVVEIFHHNPNYPTEGISEEVAAIVQDNPKHQLTEVEKLAVENNLKAHAELVEQIGELTYMEPDGFTIGRCYIGLPYESIEAVAALENVDYIDLPREKGSVITAQEKYSDTLIGAMYDYSPDATVRIAVGFAYTEHTYIGMAEPGHNCTVEEINAYIQRHDEARKAYFAEKNKEYAAIISAHAEVNDVALAQYYTSVRVTTKLKEVEKIASLKEVSYILFINYVHEPHNQTQVYAERFEQWIYSTMGLKKFNYLLSKSDPAYDFWNTFDNYDELYSTDDWALVYATVNINDPWEFVDHIRIGDRILSWYMPGAAIYPFGYFVYNASEDTFYPIDRFVYPVRGYAHTDNGEFIYDENGRHVMVDIEPVISLDDYPGLVEALDELEIGRAVGDANGDGELTILDATQIQRVKAGLEEPDEAEDLYLTGYGDEYSEIEEKSWSDADDDGSVTILDATRIQRTLADLCTIDGRAKNIPAV